MVNTRQKGRRNETRARDAMLAMGYQVQMTAMPSKWSTQNDLFGLWDLIAINADTIRFVQVKTNQTAPPAWRKEASAWQCPNNCTKEIWIYKDRIKEPIIKLL